MRAVPFATALRLHRWPRRRPQHCTPGCELLSTAPCEYNVAHECRGVGGAQVVGPLGDLEHMRRLLGDGALLDAGDLVRSAAKPSQLRGFAHCLSASRRLQLHLDIRRRRAPRARMDARTRTLPGLLSPAGRARSRAALRWACRYG